MVLLARKNGSVVTVFALVFMLLSSLIKADVQVVLPMEGRTFEASGSTIPITIGWLDNQQYPLVSEDITSYTFSLCSGPNSHIESIKTLATKVSPDAVTLDGIIYKYDLEIDAAVAESGTFFIQVFATGSFGYTIHYSSRFQLTGLTGTIVPSSAGAATAAPSAQYSINTGTTTVASINSASFTIPYPQQSGISKFAPMQMQPKNTVSNPTATWTRRFPTSAVTYYSTAVPGSLRNCKTTVTPGWSYYITSDINYQTGQTKTNTGYDPKERQTRTTQRLI